MILRNLNVDTRRDLIENGIKIYKGFYSALKCIDVFVTYMSLIKGQCRVMVVILLLWQKTHWLGSLTNEAICLLGAMRR